METNTKTQFTAKTFNLPELKGISAKNIEEHLKLYAGYVKFANHILASLDELAKDGEKYAYELGELQRRFGFEFGGMRNHEIYFSSLEGGPSTLPEDSQLRTALSTEFSSFDAWLARFKAIAMTRGVGWAMLYYDKASGKIIHAWVEEQHLGHLPGLTPILALDMWEHAYVYDYPTSEKKKYVEAFFENLNWDVVEENFKNSK